MAERDGGPAHERRRASRWQSAVEVLGAQWTLARASPDALPRLLPFALGRAPERAVVIARGEIAGAAAEVLECESTLHLSGESTSVESLVLVLDLEHASGPVAIEFDPLTAFGGATPRDPSVGHAEFDRCYRVHAPSELAARRAIPVGLAQELLARRFRGTLELRTGRVIACFAETRLSPPSARMITRLVRSIVRGLARPSGGPYRGRDPRR